jgi:hypothetical protein
MNILPSIQFGNESSYIFVVSVVRSPNYEVDFD